MRKNIKILIASLSVLTVAATVTAITVPLVMNAKQIDDSNFIKNKTVKTVSIKDNSMDQILKANTEAKMRAEVKKMNDNKSWDNFFTFTNENDGLLTDIVSEVIFSLENNDKAVFAINYIDDIKITNGSNIVKVNLNTGSFVTRADDFQDKIDLVSNKLNDLLKKESSIDAQKIIFDGWGKNTPIEIRDGLVDSLIFNTEDKWDLVVKEIIVTPEANYEPSVKKPNLAIQVKLNNGYIISSDDEQKLKFNITLDPIIGLSISKSTDYNNLLTNATNVLNSLLTGDFNNQKEIYEGWNNNPAPDNFKNAIKGILSFNNGSVKWDDAVEDVILKTATFPTKPGEPIPPVEIKINLKDVYG
ncbi:MAG: hypothetical protein ACRDCD_00155, partial [Mycoplasmoidaceae bacterium]